MALAQAFTSSWRKPMSSKKSKRINALIIEKNWPGVTVGTKENKLGIRGSDTHSIQFTDVRVPKENRIGKDGFGFKFAMQVLMVADWHRCAGLRNCGRSI